MEKRLKFRIPMVPTSSKNSRSNVVTAGGRIRSFPSTKAKRHKQEIRGVAEVALRAAGGWFGAEDELGILIRHLVEAEEVEVEIWRIGPKPRGRTGRGRDIDNLASTIMDSLNRLAYQDDRQIGVLHVERVVG